MTAEARAPVVELVEVKVGRGDQTVIDRIDLAISTGESVAIAGRSGTGKSTLLETVIGLVPPLAGEIRLFGEPLPLPGHPGRDALLRRIGVVFQQDALFRAMTVADNLAVAPRALLQLPEPVIAELCALKLEQVGLAGVGQRFPYELSGGQQKRVAFARAVMLDPELVVCDEPTAGLDSISAANIAALIARLRDETRAAVLLVTHDVELIQATAGRALVIGDGRVRADGPVESLVDHPDPSVSALFTRKPLVEEGGVA
ncbi:MAG TPA: ATP-binding cassette domain-containing protein [Kofleriaceae bacterium]|jgi:phospholipid/cholesterol/gamma-HCH transport system ATP-binding protein|nr:ATP-binding cassette domain-containing protein [Kofleriaceae bacterium]